MIKKKLLSIIALCALSATTALGAIAGTAAWFNDKITIEEGENLKGNSLGAYFAYGDGSGSDGQKPYGITKPRHLYNLAWLQYLGKYFKDGNNYPQYYFKLDADLDMTGYVLPPIGTTLNPFIGFFDGNNHTISNLTVSNNIADYANKVKPSVIGDEINDCQIIGFFGVIGDIAGAAYSISGDTAPYAKNFILDNTTVKTTSAQSLIGIGAGYVNGVLSGVGVGKSQLSIGAGVSYLNSSWTENVSEYSLVGYCTPTYRSTTKVVDITAMDPTVKSGADGGGNEFGNSLPMSSMFSSVSKKKTATSNDSNNQKVTYVSQIDRYYDKEGNVESETSSTTTTDYPSGINSLISSYDTNNGVTTAEYTFQNSTATAYMYLAGNSRTNGSTISDGLTINEYRYKDTENGFRLSFDDDGTTHYLDYSNGQIGDTTSEGSKIWYYSGSSIYTYVDNQPKYLFHNGTTLGITDNPSASGANWVFNDVTSNLVSGTYYLAYQNGWKAINDTNYGRFYIKSGDDYLSAATGNNDYGIFQAVSKSSATVWTLVEDSGVNYVKAVSGSNQYYLTTWTSSSMNLSFEAGYSGNYYGLHLIESDGNYSICYPDKGWYVYLKDKNSTSTAWALKTSESFVELESAVDYPMGVFSYESATEKVRVLDSSTNEDVYITSRPTYFPLLYQESGSVSPKNSGYLVSGSNLTGTSSDIRISRYSASDLLESLNLPFKIRYVTYDSYDDQVNHYLTTNYRNAFTASTSNPDSYQWRVDANSHLFLTYNSTTYYLSFNAKNRAPNLQTSASKALVFDGYYLTYKEGNTTYYYSTSDTMTSNSGNAASFIRSASSVNFSNNNLTSKLEIITKTSKTNNNYVRIQDAFNGSNGTINTDVSATISNLGNPWTPTNLGFEDYENARQEFQTMLLASTTYAYGLHFMDAQISIDHTIDINYAMVNGKEYRYTQDISNGESHYSSYTNKVQYDPESGEALKEDNGDLKVIRTKDEDDPGGKYQLPEDCIDFNLTTYGNVKFFAGTYFPSNTTFFSLHKIDRNNQSGNKLQITGINEIRKVFLNTSYEPPEEGREAVSPKYVYQYRNGYSHANNSIVGYNSENEPIYVTYDQNDPIFDMSWVTDIGSQMISNACYYFEIPLNEGEYALGSVSGANGAYLMYLDIGASDNSANITKVSEQITTTVSSFFHPAGIDFVLPTSLNGDDKCSGIDGESIGTVYVGSDESAQTINYLATANSVNFTGAQGESGSTFVGDGATVYKDSTEIDPSPDLSVSELKESSIKYTFERSTQKMYTEESGYKTETKTSKGSSPQKGAKTPYSNDRTQEAMTADEYDNEFKFKLRTGTANTVFVELQWYEVGWCEVEYSYQFRYSKTNDNYYYKFTFDADTAEGSKKKFTQNLEVHRLQLLSGQDLVVYGINAARDAYEIKEPANNTYAILPTTLPQQDEQNQEQSGS